MLTKLEKKEYRKLGKLILSLPTDSKQFHEITPRFLELNQKNTILFTIEGLNNE